MASPRQVADVRERIDEEKPEPRDLSHHLSTVSKNRVSSSLKALYKYSQLPGVRNLAGGLPYAGYFPFDTFESAVATGNRFPAGPSISLAADPISRNFFLRLLSTNPFIPDNPKSSPNKTTRLSVPKFFPDPSASADKIIDIATALQYGTSEGYPSLLAWVKEFALEHQFKGKIPYKDPGVILTCGSTDGFNKVMQTIAEGRLMYTHDGEVRPGGRGDSLLVEEYAYTTAVQTAAPWGIGIVPIKCDEEGMSPLHLRTVLSSWNVKQMGKRPSVMYTVTIGQNPTGGVLSLERRKEIYKICDEFDIIIAEDDPYWYLQYPEKYAPAASTQPDSANCQTSGDDFVSGLVPSYITIDTSGRVIHMSTFSKTIAPGCRMGYIVAQPVFIERILRLTECSSQQPSGFVQAMVAELLVDVWGISGWTRWLESLRLQYWIRMSTMCEILERGKYTTAVMHSSVPEYTVVSKQAMYDFNWPKGGMFVWLHVHITDHPSFEGLLSSMISTPEWDDPIVAKNKLIEALMTKLWVLLAGKHLVLVAPGSNFSPTEGMRASSWEYLRLCFAAVEDESVTSSSKGFVEGVAEFWEERWERWDEVDPDQEDATTVGQQALEFC